MGSIPVYGTGGIIARVDEYVATGPSILLPRKGSISNVYYVEEPFWNVDTIYRTEIDETTINPKFLYHYLTNFRIERLNTSNAARPALTRKVLSNIPVPLLPLDDQLAIAEMLDRFDTLVNDIFIGLPAEIEARRKQYEYYRDKLLTFKEKES